MVELVAGTLLGGTWKLESLLGQGGMGAVWIASHTRLPKRFAVKVLHDVSSEDVEMLARFRREAEIASRLDHPHIVQVVDFNVESGAPYIVMELLRGTSLAERVSVGRLSGAEAVLLARQVASALEAAHADSVIHRDLTPRNIFLADEEVLAADGVPWRVKVLDFGISKLLGGSTLKTAESAVLGTPAYMAPEQARGEQSAIGPWTDQFALGVVMHEALSGSRPFDGESVPSVLYRVVHEPPPSLLGQVADDVSLTMIEAVDRAMAKVPAERFRSVSEFAEVFSGVAGPASAVLKTSGTGDSVSDISQDRSERSQQQTVAGVVRPGSGVKATMVKSNITDRPEVSHGADAVASTTPAVSANVAAAAIAGTLGTAPSSLATAGGPPQNLPAGRSTSTLLTWAVAATVVLSLVGYGLFAAMSGSEPPSKEAAAAKPAPQEVQGAKRVAVQTPDSRGGETGPVAEEAAHVAAGPPPTDGGPVSAIGRDVTSGGDAQGDTGDAVVGVVDADATDPGDTFDDGGDSGSEPTGDDVRVAKKRPVAPSLRPRRPINPPAADRPPDEAKQLLSQAKVALAKGDFKSAERLARKSLQARRSSGAIEVIAKSNCLQRRGVAAAGFGRQLSKRRQSALRKYCWNQAKVELPL